MSAKKEEVKEEAKEQAEEAAEDKASESADLPAKLVKIIDGISELTVLEVSKLVKGMEDKFGVTAQAAVAMPAMAGVAGAPAAEAEAEEKTAFDVVLKDFGSAKIKVIKVVRELTSLSLKEAKTLVESAPAKIKEGVLKDEADTIKGSIEEAGGVVEIQ